MGARGTSDALGRRASILLAMVALALIVFIPPGFMVGGQDGGPARIVICTGHGPVEAALDLGGKSAPAHGKKAGSPCVFAGHAAPAVASPTAPVFAAAWASAPASITLPTSQVSIDRAPAAPPPARAPPFFPG